MFSVPFDEPWWWYGARRSMPERLLAPIGAAWGYATEARYRSQKPYWSTLPVICVGNFTVGGTGKTPVAMAIAGMLRDLGEEPAFLTRGYGGRIATSHWVDAESDPSALVGDEPLLLARMAPVMVSKKRALGARAIEARQPPVSVIVMDDGLQNGALQKDLALAVVDGRRGIGNGRVVPAGPLRAPLQSQLRRVDAVIVNHPAGDRDAANRQGTLPQFGSGKPVLACEAVPAGDVAWLRGATVVAYAGIGSPGRFFDMLAALGARIVERRAFADHHAFTDGDAQALLQRADASKATLVTTEKDWVRLRGQDGGRAELRNASRTLPIIAKFDDADQAKLLGLLRSALGHRAHGATSSGGGSRGTG